jgi:hypothetical protein
MAKKLTKAQIAKNPTKAINSGKMKMKKQEVPLSGLGKAAVKAVGKVLSKSTAKKTAVKNELKEFKADRVNQLGQYADHPGGASFKSNKRLVEKGKWSSPKQIAKYQKQEVKQDIKANARGLKAAQGKLLAPKKYKADSEGRKQVNRFAAPLEKANVKKTAMRMGAQTVDIGRSSIRIKPAVKNRNK